MNLVFIGATTFGLRCLMICLALSDRRVSGIVTTPETFAISYRSSGVTNKLHTDAAELANSYTISVQTLMRSMSEASLFDALVVWKPDILLVAGWYL